MCKGSAAKFSEFIVVFDDLLIFQMSFDDGFSHESYVLGGYSKAVFDAGASETGSYFFEFLFLFDGG